MPTITQKLRPFVQPRFVSVLGAAGSEAPTIHVFDLPRETVAALCDELKAGMLAVWDEKNRTAAQAHGEGAGS